ncbi:unnamed protein product [Closterium sp. NIES-53]
MEAEGSVLAGPSGSGGVRGAGEAGRGIAGGSLPIASVSTPAKDDVKAFNLEKFSGEDWASWSFKMELLFNHYGLLEVMDGELKRPAIEGATKEWDRRSKDGFFLLSQCLSSNQLHHVKHLIKDIQCGPKAWKILKDVHAPSSEAMVVVLERQLHAVKINQGDAVQGAFDQLRDLYVSRSTFPVRFVRASRVSRPRPPPVPGTQSMSLRPSTAQQRVPLPSPPASSLPDGPDPQSDSLRAASPTVSRFLATAVIDPLFESFAASALVTELVDFAAACRLDPDAPDIPTPRSYAEAIEGPYSSQWQAAMNVKMASWKSTGIYVDKVPPHGANMVQQVLMRSSFTYSSP